MAKIFIIHGAYGHPKENWIPWLKLELEKLGLNVVIPKFPTPENQSLENWQKIMETYDIESDDILIGHSIGPALILHLLETYKAKAAFLIAGFIGALCFDEVDTINASFFKNPFDWNKIKQNCKNDGNTHQNAPADMVAVFKKLLYGCFGFSNIHRKL